MARRRSVETLSDNDRAWIRNLVDRRMQAHHKVPVDPKFARSRKLSLSKAERAFARKIVKSRIRRYVRICDGKKVQKARPGKPGKKAIQIHKTITKRLRLFFRMEHTMVAPTVVKPGKQRFAVGERVEAALVAESDINARLVTTATGLPPGITVNSKSGVMKGKFAQEGDYTVFVKVTDGVNESDFDFDIEVISVGETLGGGQGTNLAPIVQDIPAQSLTVGDSFSYQVEAQDPDNDALTFVAPLLPSGLSINGTGLISGTPTTPGATEVSVTVSDGRTSTTKVGQFSVTTSGGGGGDPTGPFPMSSITGLRPLGSNCGRENYFNQTYFARDVMKARVPAAIACNKIGGTLQAANNVQLPLGPNRKPTSLTVGGTTFAGVQYTTYLHSPNQVPGYEGQYAYKAGRYVCTYQGPPGRCQIPSSTGTVVNGETTNRVVFDVVPSNQGIQVRFDGLITDFEVCLLEDEGKQTLVNDAYVADMQPYGVVRTMDLTNTNTATLVNWDDRPTLDWGTYSSDETLAGWPVEYLVELANRTNSALWYNMPYAASDDCVEKILTLIKNTLNPALKLILERGNEPWNFGWKFKDSEYLVNKYGAGQNLKGNAAEVWRVMNIAKQVFGAEYSSRVHMTINCQVANFGVVPYWYENQDYSDVGIPSNTNIIEHVDSLAIAPYIGGHMWGAFEGQIAADLDKQKIWNELRNGSEYSKPGQNGNLTRNQTYYKDLYSMYVADSSLHIKQWTNYCQTKGLKLIVYEAGSHITGKGGQPAVLDSFIREVNRDPEMAKIYGESLDYWFDDPTGTRDVFCLFQNTFSPTATQDWGLKYNLYDAAHPKNAAMTAYAETKFQ